MPLQAERLEIERLQKSALYIILGEEYESYKLALKKLDLDDLESRRNKLCLKFGKKAEKHEKFNKWFKPNNDPVNTRQEKLKYCDVQYSHDRFISSLPKNVLLGINPQQAHHARYLAVFLVWRTELML